MTKVRWYLARDQQKVGPFSGGDLKQLAVHGLLKATEYVWAEGASKWVQANSLAGLFAKTGQKKFWLTVEGQVRGPYVVEQIQAGLNAGKCTLQTPARPEEGGAWTPLGSIAEFRDFTPVPTSPSQAKVLAGTLDIGEATLHLAGKSGDPLAKLISTLMDLKRSYADSPALVETLEKSIQVLQAKREEAVAAGP